MAHSRFALVETASKYSISFVHSTDHKHVLHAQAWKGQGVFIMPNTSISKSIFIKHGRRTMAVLALLTLNLTRHNNIVKVQISLQNGPTVNN